MMSPPATSAAPPLVRLSAIPRAAAPSRWTRLVPAWVASGLVHCVLVGLFLVTTVSGGAAPVETDVVVIETRVEDEPVEANLENEDIGLDPGELLNFDVGRIEDVSVPGMVDPAAAVGLLDAPAAALMNVPPPPGIGGSAGQGGGLDASLPGPAALTGLPGGLGGTLLPGGFGGRSGATRQQLLREGGGNDVSEAAVARGQRWLANHQAADGHWSLDGFRQHGRCRCTGAGQRNDIAATAFGLLPLLAAGETHRNPRALYRDNVERGLKYLLVKQGRDGGFGGGMYAHGLATIALCEAYGLTSDPRLKAPAQRAINYIRAAQSDNGGWRYQPRQGGDTSVFGWQLMALKSGQMAGLVVDGGDTPTFARAVRWLNSVQTFDGGGYGYTSPQATPTMSAVGLLCRQYLGWGPRNPGLIAGIKRLQQTPPGRLKNLYYDYYATQVMHHAGGEAWASWNSAMRNLHVASQDTGSRKGYEHQRGSWSPEGDAHGGAGGRIMTTSLALLTLEVYYRHLPLYRRDLGGLKAMAP